MSSLFCTGVPASTVQRRQKEMVWSCGLSPRLSGAPWTAASSSPCVERQAVPDRFVGSGFVDGVDDKARVVVPGIDRCIGVVGCGSGIADAAPDGRIGGAAAGFDLHLLAVHDDQLAVGKARLGQGDAGLDRVDGRGQAGLLVGHENPAVLDIAVGAVVAVGLGVGKIPFRNLLGQSFIEIQMDGHHSLL